MGTACRPTKTEPVWTAEMVEKVQALAARMELQSLDALISNDEGDDCDFYRFISDDAAPPPEEAVIRKETVERVRKAIAQLKPRQAQVIALRYGIYDGKEWTLDEIGKKFGITRERVRQIEYKAKQRLKNIMTGMHLSQEDY